MNVVRVKDGVKFGRIAPAGFAILAALHSATQVLHLDVVITSGTDSHDHGGPHSAGEAYDLSIAKYSVDETLDLRRYLQKCLGELFTVLYETPIRPEHPRLATIAVINQAASAPHLHVQRKKGTIYPPPPAEGLKA